MVVMQVMVVVITVMMLQLLAMVLMSAMVFDSQDPDMEFVQCVAFTFAIVAAAASVTNRC